MLHYEFPQSLLLSRYHDLCDPSDVPQEVEMAFHDYEKPCANHFCNMIGVRAFLYAFSIPQFK